jgi:hypothetical protein
MHLSRLATVPVHPMRADEHSRGQVPACHLKVATTAILTFGPQTSFRRFAMQVQGSQAKYIVIINPSKVCLR